MKLRTWKKWLKGEKILLDPEASDRKLKYANYCHMRMNEIRVKLFAKGIRYFMNNI